MRQNPAKSAAGRGGDGIGPIYAALLGDETARQARYGRVGDMPRPRHLLDALLARETVTVPFWKVPVELRPTDCEAELVVSP